MKNTSIITSKKGISLITLIITIIVIIILSTIVIINLSNTGIFESTDKAVLRNDVSTFKDELYLYAVSKTSDTYGKYISDSLQADKNTLYEEYNKVENSNISSIITKMNNTRYEDILEIENGKLVYSGDNEEEYEKIKDIIGRKKFNINIVETIPNQTSIFQEIILYGPLFEINNIKEYNIYASLDKENFPSTPNLTLTTDSKNVKYTVNDLKANTKYYLLIEVVLKNGNTYKKITDSITTLEDNYPPQDPIIIADTYYNKLDNIIAEVQLSDNDGGSGIDRFNCKYLISSSNEKYDKADNIWNNASKFEEQNFQDLENPNNGKINLSVTDDGEYYIQALAIDYENNISIGISNKIIIDTKAPDITGISVSLNPNTWTNSDVSVTINGIPIDAVIKQYTLPGSNIWNEYKNTFMVNQNGIINIRVEDVAGNESIMTVSIDKIDKIGPNDISLSPNEVTNVKSVSVKVTATDSPSTDKYAKSDIDEIKYIWSSFKEKLDINSSSWDNAEVLANGGTLIKNNITATQYLHILAKDKAGNKTSKVSGAYVLDNTAPDVSKITATLNPDSWTKEDVTVTLNNIPIDATKKQYTLPGGSTWNDYTSPFSVSQNGTINVRVEDASGNESTMTVVITKIDKTVPNSFTPTITKGMDYISVSSSTTDSGSGIKGYQFSLDNGATWSAVQDSGSYTFNNLKQSTSYKVKVKALDNVLNERVYSDTISTVSQVIVVNSASNLPTGIENQIAVISNLAISNWSYGTGESYLNASSSSIIRPSNPVSGQIYLGSDSTSNAPSRTDVQFVLKDGTNASFVPGLVSQYNGSSWEYKEFYVYKNGTWVQYHLKATFYEKGSDPSTFGITWSRVQQSPTNISTSFSTSGSATSTSITASAWFGGSTINGVGNAHMVANQYINTFYIYNLRVNRTYSGTGISYLGFYRNSSAWGGPPPMDTFLVANNQETSSYYLYGSANQNISSIGTVGNTSVKTSINLYDRLCITARVTSSSNFSFNCTKLYCY